MWARSDDREARWSQLVRASTQPDSAPYIDSNSSSSCWSWTRWPWLKIIQKPILQSSTKNRRRRRIDGLITCGAEEEDEPVSWFAIHRERERERETVVLTFSNRVEAEPSGKTTTLRSLGFCVLKSMKNYILPPHLGWWGDFLTQPTMVGQKNSTQPNLSYKSNPIQLNLYKLGWVGLNPWVWPKKIYYY